ncbi:MFS transporter [Hydrogenophaga sp.]|uniref:MFS transporter n=1 Tax=Hydrogenophaga sp. TaxID=1904254 RepID=UPI003561796B
MKSLTADADPAVPDPAVQRRTAPARWALFSLALSMLLSSLGVSIANVALPTLAQAFSVPFHQVQWVVLAYLLASTVLIVSAGRMGDVWGHRRVLLAGILLFTLASLLCGVAPTLGTLIAARALQGLAAAILMALTVVLVRQAVPPEKTGSAMGLLGTMSAVGTALGPSLGGFLIAGPGWRAIFLIMVPLGLLNAVLAQRSLPRREPATGLAGPVGQGFDAWGTLVLGLTLAAYALAVTTGGGHWGRLNTALLFSACLGAGLFVWVQARVASPLIRLAALRDASLRASLGTNALVSTVMMATLVVGPFFLARALGLNPVLVGIVMSIGPLVSALSGVPAGRLVDRWGAPGGVATGLVALAAGAFALSVLPALFGVAGYVAAIALLTPGYQLFQAANNTAVMMNVPADQRGVISGLLSLSRNLGLITGASVMGAVFAWAAASHDMGTAPPDAVATGMRTTFVVAGVLMIAALAIFAATARRAVRDTRQGAR